MTRPFRVSVDYIDWAHGSAAEDGQPLAKRLDSATIYCDSRSAYKLLDDPVLVAEVADVAELYVGGSDSDLRAAQVRARAVRWLRERGLTVRQVLKAHAEASPDIDQTPTKE